MYLTRVCSCELYWTWLLCQGQGQLNRKEIRCVSLSPHVYPRHASWCSSLGVGVANGSLDGQRGCQDDRGNICVALLFLVSLLSVMCSAVLFTRPHCYTNSQYMWMITDKWCAWSNLVRHSWQFSGKSDTINREMKSASEFHGARNSFLNLFLCLIHLIISKITVSLH